MNLYHMYAETDPRTVFFVFYISIVNMTWRSTVYIRTRSPGYILYLRGGFHPVARLREYYRCTHFRGRNNFATWYYVASPPTEVLKLWNSREGWTVFEEMEGVGASDCTELRTRIWGLSALGIRFPLIKNGGESHYILALYYYIIVIYMRDRRSSVGESHFRETHTARRTISATSHPRRIF